MLFAPSSVWFFLINTLINCVRRSFNSGIKRKDRRINGQWFLKKLLLITLITLITPALFIVLCLTQQRLSTGLNIVNCICYFVGRDLPSAWLRLLVIIYTNSSIRIAWNGIMFCSVIDRSITVSSKAEVMSPILFCTYLDGLLNLLVAAQIGCFIGRVFVGCLALADWWHSFISPNHRWYAQYACNLWFVCKRIRLNF